MCKVRALCVNVFFLLLLLEAICLSRTRAPASRHAPMLKLPRPFSPLAGSNYSYFFSLGSCGLLLRSSFYLSSIWHRIASHRSIVSFPFQCELNCPIALGHCLSIIMLSVICFHAPLQALSISQHKKQGRT